MSLVSIAKAAELAGISRQAMNKATKEGKLSYTLNARNQKVIDVAELGRIYELKLSVDQLKASSDVKEADKASTNSSTELSELKKRVTELEKERDDIQKRTQKEKELLEERIGELKESVEHSRAQEKRITLALTHQSEKSESRGLAQKEELAKLHENAKKQELINRKLLKEFRAMREKTWLQRLVRW